MNTRTLSIVSLAWISTLGGAYIVGSIRSENTASETSTNAVEEDAVNASVPSSFTDPIISDAEQAALAKLKKLGGDDILLKLGNLNPRMLQAMAQDDRFANRQNLSSREAASQLIESLKNGVTNRREIWSILGRIEPSEIPETVRQLSEMGNSNVRGVAARLIARLAREDPRSAVELASAIEADSMRSDAMGNVFAEWARREPEAAIDWIAANPDLDLETISRSVNAAFRSYARQDLDSATNLLSGIEDDAVRTSATRGIFEAMVRSEDSDWDAITSFILEQPADLRSSLVDITSSSPRFGGLENGNALAEQFFAEDPALANQVYLEIGRAQGRDFPAETAEWALGLENPETSEAIVNDIMRRWSVQDPEEAGAWLAQTEPSAILDDTYQTYASATARQDPASAITWAEAITDADLRDAAVTEIASVWAENDPTAASAYVQATQYLSTDARQSLLNIFNSDG
ncbi:MAG: hypothetical protein AAGB06_01085 [Verrucomicrobiota bacterium]